MKRRAFDPKAQFLYYFDVADELDGGLTLDDLDNDFTSRARSAAEYYGLPWPPELAAAEDFALDNPAAMR